MAQSWKIHRLKNKRDEVEVHACKERLHVCFLAELTNHEVKKRKKKQSDKVTVIKKGHLLAQDNWPFAGSAGATGIWRTPQHSKPCQCLLNKTQYLTGPSCTHCHPIALSHFPTPPRCLRTDSRLSGDTRAAPRVVRLVRTGAGSSPG